MTDERTVLDEMTDASALLDQWDAKLQETPGDADAKSQVRNWAIPMFRKLLTIIEGVATDLVDDVDEQVGDLALRVDEVSALARATLGTQGMAQVLAQTHEFARRVLAADIGEETQEMGQQLLDVCEPHARAFGQAVAHAEALASATQTPTEPTTPSNGQEGTEAPAEPKTKAKAKAETQPETPATT